MKKFAEFVSEAKDHSLWKHNPRSGYWDYKRKVTPDTKDQWMTVFQKDEPDAHFVVSKKMIYQAKQAIFILISAAD